MCQQAKPKQIPYWQLLSYQRLQFFLSQNKQVQINANVYSFVKGIPPALNELYVQNLREQQASGKVTTLITMQLSKNFLLVLIISTSYIKIIFCVLHFRLSQILLHVVSIEGLVKPRLLESVEHLHFGKAIRNWWNCLLKTHQYQCQKIIKVVEYISHLFLLTIFKDNLWETKEQVRRFDNRKQTLLKYVIYQIKKLIILFLGMPKKSLDQFEHLYAQFKMREQEVPQRIKWKLLFISSKIHNHPLQFNDLSTIQEEQIQQLINLDTNTLAIIFNTLVKTLIIEKKSEERQCKIKYAGLFEFWKNCKILTQGKYLVLINQKSINKYELSLLSIINCRNGKRSFELYFKNHLLYYVKFTNELSFKEFVAHLQCELQLAKEPQLKNHQEISKVNINENEQSQMKDNINRQSQSQMMIKQNTINDIKLQEKPSGYKIIEQAENLLVCLKEGQSRAHISVLMNSNSQLEKIVNYFIQQKLWNGSISEENIKQSFDNIYEVHRVYKKQSLFSFERASLTRLKVICNKNSASIMEESFEDEQKSQKESNILCLVKSFTKFYRCLGGIKIIIDCQFNARGYCKTKDSINMLLKIYEDMKYFENSFKISQLQKSKIRVIVQPSIQSKSPRKFLKRQSSKIMEENNSSQLYLKKQNEEYENMNTNDTLQLLPIKPLQNQQEALNQFLKLKPVNPMEIPCEDYISMVQNYQNQKYYLNYRFNQSILKKYDSYIPFYTLSELFKKGNQYRISKDNELIYINYQVLNGQKESLKFIIKQIGANLITGKSVLNVSMPVDIFQSRSLLERSAAVFGSTPQYLLPVADSDPFTQMKNVLTFIFSIPTLQLLMQKPFNPILGETFEATIKGIPIYYEQISHHPPISAYFMTCPEFTMYGNLVAFADISINSAVGGNEGVMHILFRNGSHFQCYFPPCQISGLIFGNRTFRAYGRGYILQKNSNLFAQVSIQKQKKGLYQKGDVDLSPADLIGGIFKVKPQFMDQISQQSSLRKYSGLTKKQINDKMCQIRGIWFQEILFDGHPINQQIKVFPLQYPKICLPSDSNYRQDILYHKIRNLPQSQRMKEVLQVKQRSDRKLRQKYTKSLKKRS